MHSHRRKRLDRRLRSLRSLGTAELSVVAGTGDVDGGTSTGEVVAIPGSPVETSAIREGGRTVGAGVRT